MKQLTHLTILMLIIVMTTVAGNAVVAQDDDDEENFTALDYFEQGMGYYNNQDYELAIADFTSALELDAEFADAYFYRALSRYNQDFRDQDMIDDFTNALEYEFSDTAWTHNLRGLTYLGMEAYDSALADFETALELSPTYRSALQNIAHAYSLIPDWVLYVQTYKRMGENFDPDSRFYNGMAWGFVQLGRADVALRYVNISLELNPNNWNAVDTRGWAYLLLDEYDLAEAEFLRAIEEGDKYYSYYGLGVLYAELDDTERAIENLETYVELEADDAEQDAIDLLAELQSE